MIIWSPIMMPPVRSRKRPPSYLDRASQSRISKRCTLIRAELGIELNWTGTELGGPGSWVEIHGLGDQSCGTTFLGVGDWLVHRGVSGTGPLFCLSVCLSVCITQRASNFFPGVIQITALVLFLLSNLFFSFLSVNFWFWEGCGGKIPLDRGWRKSFGESMGDLSNRSLFFGFLIFVFLGYA